MRLFDIEAILDDQVVEEVTEKIEAALPKGARRRQLRIRTLLAGMLACQADHRPAHLTRAHRALLCLDAADQRRLGVLADWGQKEHQLTYRQVERTYALMSSVLAKPTPDGAPSELLSELTEALMEASVPERWKGASSSLAVDWTDHESFASPPTKGGRSADPEASWGRRKGGGPGQRDELFFGYYLQAATMVKDEGQPEVPELTRRITVSTCHLDAPRAVVPVLERLRDSEVAIGDVLCDSGYAHRAAEAFALPVRALGAELVMDLHPHDRGPKGTFAGAILNNGRLYCPLTPSSLLGLGPLARDADTQTVEAHDQKTAELSRYKLSRLSRDDADGYHRVGCPAVEGKLRCPLRPASMALSADRPEVFTPPEIPPRCCVQTSVTVPVSVNAMTAQKHDYPSQAWRRSYARRTAVERTFARGKDRATNDIGRGWCRLTGIAAITAFLACVFVVRNQSVVDAFEQRARRAPAAPRRRRRRTSISDLIMAGSVG